MPLERQDDKGPDRALRFRCVWNKCNGFLRGTGNELRHRVAIRFAIEGDLRFISHHDTIRLFERALSRAQLPVKFSEGFNPRPKLSLPCPRTVGVYSQADVLVVDLSEPMAANDFSTRLAKQMPAGINLFKAWEITGKRTLQVDRVEYAVDLPGESLPEVKKRLKLLRESDTLTLKRAGHGKKSAKTIDLCEYVIEASVDNLTLRWTVLVTRQGTLRPAEFLSAVGLDADLWLHRVRRTEIHWSNDVPEKAQGG